jgi:hypothetical protein
VRPLAAIFVAAAALTFGAAGALACSVHTGLGAPIGGPSAIAALFPAVWDGTATFGPAAPAATAAPLVAPKTKYRLRLVGHADPQEGYTADVWAHRGYAYLSSWGGPACLSDGVRVYDLARPARPSRVSTFADAESDPAVAGTWTEKTIVQHVATPAFSGELAVTSFQSCRENSFRGFGVYDVTDPRAPRRLALVRTDPRGSHEIWLQPRAGAAYVYTAIIDSETMSAPDYDPRTHSASTPGKADFRVFDVSNPAAPTEVASWGAWRELGLHPHPGGGSEQNPDLYFVHSVRSNAAGTQTYLSYWDLGTVILDTTDPAAPRYVGRTPPADDAHSTALGRNGTLLVETHETFGGLPTFFDVSNPARPKRLGELALAAASRPAPAGATAIMNGVHDPDVSGTRAFFSWYSQGVLATDIAKPGKPRVLAQFLPPLRADPQQTLCRSAPCRVVWGIALDRGYVLASDMLSGLYVLKLEPRPPKRRT